MADTKQKTIAYIDGFNIYYGSSRKTPYKWLDLRPLFSKLLSRHHDITEIKYLQLEYLTEIMINKLLSIKKLILMLGNISTRSELSSPYIG